MAKTTGRLTIFAGSGALVPYAINAALAAGYRVQVLSLAPRPDITKVKTGTFDLGNPIGIVWSIKVFRTTHIVMAGGIDLPDKAREGLVKFAGGGGSAGPTAPVGDATLAALGSVLKKMTGADLVGIHELCPELLAPAGLIAGPKLLQAAGDFGAFALATARAIGRLDIGQAAVVSGNRVIAVEDIGGTDDLIARVANLRQKGLTGDGEAKLILAKSMKPQQPGFVDLPSIGAQTVLNCAAAGITAIVVEAERSLLLERDMLQAAAIDNDITIVGIAPTDG